MMQGALFQLSENNGLSLFNFKERKTPPIGFYAVWDGELQAGDDIHFEREGAFLNLYPTDEWYRRLTERFCALNTPKEYPAPLTRREAVLRALSLIEDYTGIQGAIPERIVPARKADGLCYHSAPPGKAMVCALDASSENPAFYLYGAYHAALYRATDAFALTDNTRRLLVSMAFFEADMLRALKRGDTSVLLKRLLKTAGAYYDCVYEEGGAFGRISEAVARFLEAGFFLLSSNASKEKQFLPLQ